MDTSHVNFLHRTVNTSDEPIMPPGYLARKQFLISETDFWTGRYGQGASSRMMNITGG